MTSKNKNYPRVAHPSPASVAPGVRPRVHPRGVRLHRRRAAAAAAAAAAVAPAHPRHPQLHRPLRRELDVKVVLADAVEEAEVDRRVAERVVGRDRVAVEGLEEQRLREKTPRRSFAQTSLSEADLRRPSTTDSPGSRGEPRDLPAQVGHVLNETGAAKLAYVGHSQGTMQVFSGMTDPRNKWLESRISVFCALAPVAFLTNLRGLLFRRLDNLPLSSVNHPKFCELSMIPAHRCAVYTKYGWIYTGVYICLMPHLD